MAVDSAAEEVLAYILSNYGTSSAAAYSERLLQLAADLL